ALMAGIYAACLIPDCLPVPLLFLGAWILFVSLFFTKGGRLPFFMILFFLVGAFHLKNADDITKRPLYPYLQEYVTVTADAASEPVYNEQNGSSRITARLRRVSFLDEELEPDETVYLTIPAKEPVPRFGQRFTAVCLFDLPRDAMNRGGFDYALHLKSKGIFFRGKAERGTLAVTGDFPLSAADRLYRLNRRCGRVLARQLPPDAAAVLQAMVLGDSSTMSEELRSCQQVSGLSHVMSVSGMHISTLVSVLYVLFAVLNRNKYKYIWLTGGLILFFMFFTGASPSVMRACIMGILVLVAQVFRRQADPLTSLAAAAGMIVLANPLAAFDAGFMLSFAAMLGLLLLTDPLKKCLLRLFYLEDSTGAAPRLASGMLTYLAVTFSAQLFLLPVVSWIFGYTTLWGFVAGLLAAPLEPVMLVGGLLISFLGLIHPAAAALVSGFTYPFVKLFLLIVYTFGHLKRGLMTIGAFTAFGVYVYGLSLFLFERLLRKKFRQCLVPALSLPVLLCVYLVFSALPGETAQLTFINVGQGDCTLLRLPRGVNMLIDGGGTPSHQGDYDVGGQIVLPYLRKAGVRRLDYVIASHPHEDHIRGLTSLLDSVPVERVVVPAGFREDAAGAAFLQKAAERQAAVSELTAGDMLSLSADCTIKALLPDTQWLSAADNENDKSLVLQFQFGRNTALFTGDLETAGEERLVSQTQAEGRTGILKAGHHGSVTSTTDAFLDWAEPQYAYIPCGQNNFGHPAPETLERLAAHGVTVYRADKDKDVTFVLSKTGIRSIRKGGSDYDEN
ncbi:MAG: DNA internalization-related competence protein ComEC/Rec2, partial [Clostridia bacterium]